MSVREDFDLTINKIIEHHTQNDVFHGYNSAFHVVAAAAAAQAQAQHQQTMAAAAAAAPMTPHATTTTTTGAAVALLHAGTGAAGVQATVGGSGAMGANLTHTPIHSHTPHHYKRSKHPADEREKSLKFVCPKCGMDFGRESYYEQHLDNVHTDLHTAKDLKMLISSSTEAECMICGTQVYHYTVRDLQAHHLMHLMYKPYRCKCHGYNFNDKATAVAHITYRRKHEPISPVLWEAGESRILDDGAHYDPEFPETGIGYTCPECGISFGGEDLWKAHCNDTHDFKTLEGLNMMRLDVASVRCNECSSMISGKWDNYKLRRHKLTHSPFKSFYCRLCKYSRKRKDDILTHIRQTHVPRGKKYY